MIPGIKLTSASGLLFLVLLLFMFGMGAYAGSQAAVNESVDITEQRENLSDVRTDIAQNLSVNESGASGHVQDLAYGTMVRQPVLTAIQAAETGLNYGYRHPWIGAMLLVLAKNLFIMVVIIAGYREAQDIYAMLSRRRL